MLRPQSAFCIMMQLAMYLKFLLTFVMFLRIYIRLADYLITDQVRPDLCLIHVVGLFVQVFNNDGVNFFIDEWLNLVEDGLVGKFCHTCGVINIIQGQNRFGANHCLELLILKYYSMPANLVLYSSLMFTDVSMPVPKWFIKLVYR